MSMDTEFVSGQVVSMHILHAYSLETHKYHCNRNIIHVVSSECDLYVQCHRKWFREEVIRLVEILYIIYIYIYVYNYKYVYGMIFVALSCKCPGVLSRTAMCYTHTSDIIGNELNSP